MECLAEDGRVLEWREVRPVDAEQKSGVDGQWHQAKCDMPTPTGTVSGRVVLVFVQPEFEPGTIDFDDLKIHTEDQSLQLHETFDQVNHRQESWEIQGESRYELDARCPAPPRSFYAQAPNSPCRWIWTLRER